MEYEEHVNRAAQIKIDISKSPSKIGIFYKSDMFNSDEEWQKFTMALSRENAGMNFNIKVDNSKIELKYLGEL
jgi:hypothetical protein